MIALLIYFLEVTLNSIVCLCDFAKRCRPSFRLNTGITLVQASVAGKKPAGLPVLLGVR